MPPMLRSRMAGLAGILLAALAPLWGAPAAQAGFPEKDITFVIPYAAGGNFDIGVRAIIPAMERYLPNKVNIVPANVASGNGGRGAAQVYRAKPDGYTIGIFNIPGVLVLQQRQETGTGYDLDKITWVGSIGSDTYGVAVPWGSALKSMDDLRRLSATRPLKFTSNGPATTVYAATLIFKDLMALPGTLITGYKSSADYLLGATRGDGDLAIGPLPSLRRLQASRSMRVLATFEAHGTFAGVPDAPGLGQPDLSKVTIERMIGAPPGLPDDVKKVLAEALRKAVEDPAVQDWARAADIELTAGSPEQAAATYREQTRFFGRWRKIITGN